MQYKAINEELLLRTLVAPLRYLDQLLVRVTSRLRARAPQAAGLPENYSGPDNEQHRPAVSSQTAVTGCATHFATNPEMWWPFGSSNEKLRGQVSTAPMTLSDIHPEATIATPIKQELSRDEQANLDFEELLKEIRIEQSKEQQKRDEARKAGTAKPTPRAIDISPDALYPTEMACRSALDYAMFCQSFGGQFVNVYRYGEFRSCSNHWSDFWLCMRTRNWVAEDKAKAIQDHYKTRAVRWKTGPSSEDIWEVRTEPVKDAFQDSLEELEAKIAEWKKTNPGATDPWLNRKDTSFNNAPPSA